MPRGIASPTPLNFDSHDVSRLQWKGGFGAHSGSSGGAPWRRAIRLIEASKAAIRYVRKTPKPVKLTRFLTRARLGGGRYDPKPPWGFWQVA